METVRKRASLESILFACSLCVFLMSRLIGIERFPIYFFTDEAVQAVAAADLVRNGFHDPAGDLLPTYFQNGPYHNLSVSVYAQVIPQLLFGFSVLATRGTSILIALSAAVAVVLTLRNVFHVRFWWLGVSILAITPAWFLHSRTAFETVLAVSFYAWFLYFYLRYRSDSPRAIYAAIASAALCFYSYNPARPVVLVACSLLLLSDARFHWESRRQLLRGALLAAVLAVPYIRFHLEHGGELAHHLRLLNSYWVTPGLGVGEKLSRFAHEYASGLDPRYWYLPEDPHDLERHRMKGYGHLLLPTLPLALLGLAICVARLRSSPHRAVLVTALAAPAGGALVGASITRVLFLVIPAAIFTALGLIAVLELLSRRLNPRVLAVVSFGVLSATSALMLSDALVRGPTWYRDYGLYGMQYGARQVSLEVRRVLDESPHTDVIISPTWANGTDVVMRFFLPDEPRVRLGSVEGHRLHRLPLDRRTLFVMTPDEYLLTRRDPRFAEIGLERTLPYPDGRIGFYFVRMEYSAAADSIFRSELRARRRPVVERVVLDGESVISEHTRFDIGGIGSLFDGDAFTLARTLEMNPAVIKLTFSRPRLLSAATVKTTTMRLDLTVEVTTAGKEERRLLFRRVLPETTVEPALTISFGTVPVAAKNVVFRIRQAESGVTEHVHIREIFLR